MGKPFIMLFYYNRRAIDEETIENGARFDGPVPKSMVIKCGITLHSLKKKIHSKLSLLENQFVSRVVY